MLDLRYRLELLHIVRAPVEPQPKALQADLPLARARAALLGERDDALSLDHID